MFFIFGLSEYLVNIYSLISEAIGIPPVTEAPAPKKNIGKGLLLFFASLIKYAKYSICNLQ